MDKSTRKQITMHKALDLRDDVIDYMHEKKREEENLPALKAALTHQYKGLQTT